MILLLYLCFPSVISRLPILTVQYIAFRTLFCNHACLEPQFILGQHSVALADLDDIYTLSYLNSISIPCRCLGTFLFKNSSLMKDLTLPWPCTLQQIPFKTLLCNHASSEPEFNLWPTSKSYC